MNKKSNRHDHDDLGATGGDNGGDNGAGRRNGQSVASALHMSIQSIAKKNHELRAHQFDSANFTICVMRVPAGQTIEERRLDVEKIYYATKGEGTMTVAGEKFDLDKGELVVVPAGATHTLAADDDDDLKLVTFEPLVRDMHPMVVSKAADRTDSG
jgi:quercetin dioxygenase-like cupin family protein